jgi:DedD protein
MREQEKFAEGRDTEITLGVAHLLGMFLSLVVLCALSMGTGYWMGRNSAKQAAAAVAPNVPAPPPAVASNKPGAAQALPPKDAATPAPNDLTFYQAVQEKDAHPQLAPQASAPAEPAAAPSNSEASRSSLGSGYLLQIAAVRYQEDAKLLSDTLRKQQYPVVVTQPGDNLFHVQVGPYADLKEAEAIRARLVSAGYNPFLKH